MSGAYHSIHVYDKLAHISYSVSCQSVVINYVSEHQMPHAIDASHSMPTTYGQSRFYVIKTDWLETLPVF